MIPTLQDIRKENLQKGTQVRQNGFKSSIHALPPKVKLRLDELLSYRLSPVNVLKSLCEEFPRVKLPSAKAVENYRNKYHIQTLTRERAFRKNETQHDMAKQEIESLVIHQTVDFCKRILPKLMKRIDLALEMEEKAQIPLRVTDQTVGTVLNVIKVMTEIVSRNDLTVVAVQKNQTVNMYNQPAVRQEARKDVDWDALLNDLIMGKVENVGDQAVVS